MRIRKILVTDISRINYTRFVAHKSNRTFIVWSRLQCLLVFIIMPNPKAYKDLQMHAVILICVGCSRVSGVGAQSLRKCCGARKFLQPYTRFADFAKLQQLLSGHALSSLSIRCCCSGCILHFLFPCIHECLTCVYFPVAVLLLHAHLALRSVCSSLHICSRKKKHSLPLSLSLRLYLYLYALSIKHIQRAQYDVQHSRARAS